MPKASLKRRKGKVTGVGRTSKGDRTLIIHNASGSKDEIIPLSRKQSVSFKAKGKTVKFKKRVTRKRKS